MKSLNWKKIAIGIVAIAVVFAGIFYFTTSTGTKPADNYVNPAFGEYISSYTAGVVSSGSVIRIALSQDAVDSALIGQESSGKLFDFKPAVSGKTVWLDKRTVEFRPEKRLVSG